MTGASVRIRNMNQRAVFLVTPTEFHNDNHERLPRVLRSAGWQVDIAAHDDVHFLDQRVFIGSNPEQRYHLIWPVGFGPRHGFLDRMQVLARASQARLITRADAYLTLHGKTAWLDYAAPTAVSSSAATLADYMRTHGGDWVLKPVAGSYGRSVVRVSKPAEIAERLTDTPGSLWMLQRFIPQIAAGETRTLICHDRIIGSYLRVPNDGLHANLATNATAAATTLSNADAELVGRVRDALKRHQVGFAAIDTVGGYVMEVNIANPGGLGTLAMLYGEPMETRFAEALSRRPVTR